MLLGKQPGFFYCLSSNHLAFVYDVSWTAQFLFLSEFNSPTRQVKASDSTVRTKKVNKVAMYRVTEGSPFENRIYPIGHDVLCQKSLLSLEPRCVSFGVQGTEQITGNSTLHKECIFCVQFDSGINSWTVSCSLADLKCTPFCSSFIFLGELNQPVLL